MSPGVLLQGTRTCFEDLVTRGEVAPMMLTCAYCGAGYDLRARTPLASPLIARADFGGPALKGWRSGSSMRGRRQGGCWVVRQPNDGQNHPLLVAPGVYHDFDVRARFRFVSAEGLDRFFFHGRGSQAGAMSLHFSYDGVVSLHWQIPEHDWRDCLASVLVVRTPHPEIVHSGYQDVRIQTAGPSVTLEVAELAIHEAGN